MLCISFSEYDTGMILLRSIESIALCLLNVITVGDVVIYGVEVSIFADETVCCVDLCDKDR